VFAQITRGSRATALLYYIVRRPHATPRWEKTHGAYLPANGCLIRDHERCTILTAPFTRYARTAFISTKQKHFIKNYEALLSHWFVGCLKTFFSDNIQRLFWGYAYQIFLHSQAALLDDLHSVPSCCEQYRSTPLDNRF